MLGLLCFTAARAEYYRYVDPNGVVCYTDDLTRIPVPQRVALESFRGITTVEQELQSTDGTGDTGVSSAQESSQDPAGSDDQAVALQQEKDRLDARYLVLKNQRDALMLEGRKALSGNDLKLYNAKVEAFNERMRQFEEEKNFYSDRVKGYYQAQTQAP